MSQSDPNRSTKQGPHAHHHHRTQIRETVVAEAVEYARCECLFLLIYEYKDMFDHGVWAVLTKDDPPRKDSQLLYTINQEDRVESTIDELLRDPILTTLCHLSDITLPIVPFNSTTLPLLYRRLTQPRHTAYFVRHSPASNTTPIAFKQAEQQTSYPKQRAQTAYFNPIPSNPVLRTTMAAGILSNPGSKFGPCVDICQHSDCKSTRIIAETLCRFCANAIGFNRRFYNNNGYVHASCLEDAVEQERSTHT